MSIGNIEWQVDLQEEQDCPDLWALKLLLPRLILRFIIVAAQQPNLCEDSSPLTLGRVRQSTPLLSTVRQDSTGVFDFQLASIEDFITHQFAVLEQYSDDSVNQLYSQYLNIDLSFHTLCIHLRVNVDQQRTYYFEYSASLIRPLIGFHVTPFDFDKVAHLNYNWCDTPNWTSLRHRDESFTTCFLRLYSPRPSLSIRQHHSWREILDLHPVDQLVLYNLFF
jgi:hypothetical protein